MMEEIGHKRFDRVSHEEEKRIVSILATPHILKDRKIRKIVSDFRDVLSKRIRLPKFRKIKKRFGSFIENIPLATEIVNTNTKKAALTRMIAYCVTSGPSVLQMRCGDISAGSSIVTQRVKEKKIPDHILKFHNEMKKLAQETVENKRRAPDNLLWPYYQDALLKKYKILKGEIREDALRVMERVRF